MSNKKQLSGLESLTGIKEEMEIAEELSVLSNNMTECSNLFLACNQA